MLSIHLAMAKQFPTGCGVSGLICHGRSKEGVCKLEEVHTRVVDGVVRMACLNHISCEPFLRLHPPSRRSCLEHAPPELRRPANNGLCCDISGP